MKGPWSRRTSQIIVVTLLGTLVNVVIAAVFNLVSDVVGGIRIAVVEERSERQPLV